MRFAGFGDRGIVNLSDDFAGFAVQVRGLACGAGLLFELVVALVGGRFVVHRVGFFFVDGFFFHRARSGEDGSGLFAGRMRTRLGRFGR